MAKKCDIFISYRRDGSEWLPRLIRETLKARGYSVFYDVTSMKSGEFDKQIFEHIRLCTDVVLILPPHALDRCINEGDWLRMEIACAIRERKNIIPLWMEGFGDYPDNLPQDICKLPRYQSLNVHKDDMYFEAMIGHLCDYLHSRPAVQPSLGAPQQTIPDTPAVPVQTEEPDDEPNHLPDNTAAAKPQHGRSPSTLARLIGDRVSKMLGIPPVSDQKQPFSEPPRPVSEPTESAAALTKPVAEKPKPASAERDAAAGQPLAWAPQLGASTPIRGPVLKPKPSQSDFVIQNGVLIRYKGNDPTVTVPNNVTVIGAGAFKSNKAIRHVILPEGLLKIESGAFARSSLCRIELPQHLESIQWWAFEQTNLTGITLPASIAEIPPLCFYSCRQLKEVRLQAAKVLHRAAFQGTKIEHIKLPSELTEIGADCFRDCTLLKGIVIPENTRQIGTDLFRGCSSLESVSLPSAIRKIPSGAFAYCPSLRYLRIGYGTEIAADAFQNSRKPEITYY